MSAGALRIVPARGPDAPTSPRGRPEVRISHNRFANVSRLDAALPACGDLFQRSLSIVQVIEERRPTLVAPGTPVVRSLNAAGLGTVIDRDIDCLKWSVKSREWTPVGCPHDAALLPLLHYGQWTGLRPICSVVEAPFLRPDGTIRQLAGYDEGTGFLLRPNAVYPTVPEHPSQADARRSLLSLQHVFADFPYTSPAASAVPIACLLTILSRAAINGCVPLFAFEASIQGSGKTLQGDVVHLIATGRLAPHSSWPEDEDEQGKRLLSLALSAAPVFFLDNVKGLFGGSCLEGIATTGELRQRVLGKSEDAVVPWLATMIVTGNNMRMTTDMLRRSLLCRVEPDVEDPTRRAGFQHPDLPEWVRSERERLIVCALTILRAYANHEYPETDCGTMASFRAWARIVPGAIRFAGGPNVLEAIGSSSEESASDEAGAIATVIRDLPRLSAEPLSARAILGLLYPAPKDGPPDGWDELREAIEVLAPLRGPAPTPKALGDALGAAKGQVSAGLRLSRTRSRSGGRQAHVWSVRPVASATKS